MSLENLKLETELAPAIVLYGLNLFTKGLKILNDASPQKALEGGAEISE